MLNFADFLPSALQKCTCNLSANDNLYYRAASVSSKASMMAIFGCMYLPTIYVAVDTDNVLYC